MKDDILNKAAQAYADSQHFDDDWGSQKDKQECVKDFKAGAEWMKDQCSNESDRLMPIAYFDGMAHAKEQLMKDAIVIDGCYIRRNNYTKQNVLNGLDVTDKAFQKFKHGDKLKIIIVEEKEK